MTYNDSKSRARQSRIFELRMMHTVFIPRRVHDVKEASPSTRETYMSSLRSERRDYRYIVTVAVGENHMYTHVARAGEMSKGVWRMISHTARLGVYMDSMPYMKFVADDGMGFCKSCHAEVEPDAHHEPYEPDTNAGGSYYLSPCCGDDVYKTRERSVSRPGVPVYTGHPMECTPNDPYDDYQYGG